MNKRCSSLSILETHSVDSVDSVGPDKLVKWGQFNDSLCYLCLFDTVVTFLSLTQELVGSNIIFYEIILQILRFNIIKFGTRKSS